MDLDASRECEKRKTHETCSVVQDRFPLATLCLCTLSLASRRVKFCVSAERLKGEAPGGDGEASRDIMTPRSQTPFGRQHMSIAPDGK